LNDWEKRSSDQSKQRCILNCGTAPRVFDKKSNPFEPTALMKAVHSSAHDKKKREVFVLEIYVEIVVEAFGFPS
jgi:hypothetical protein